MAVASPLMETSINGAHGVLINVTGCRGTWAWRMSRPPPTSCRRPAHPDANIIFAAPPSTTRLDDEIRVTVIATGFEEGKAKAPGTEGAAKPAQADGLYTQAAQQAAQPQQQAGAAARRSPAARPAGGRPLRHHLQDLQLPLRNSTKRQQYRPLTRGRYLHIRKGAAR